MKRSNLFKVVSVVMVVAMLLLSTTSAFAAVTAVQDPTSTKIEITGSFEGLDPIWNEVKVGIYDSEASNAKEYAFGQAKIIPGEKTFTILLTMPNDAPFGEYVVRAEPGTHTGTEADTITKFYFASPADKLAALKDIVATTDAAELKTKLETYKQVLSFDYTMWDGLTANTEKELQLGAATATLADLAQYRGTDVTIDILPDVLTAINREIYTQTLNGSLVDDISAIGNYTDASKYIAELTAGNITDAGVKKIVDSMIGANIANADAMEKSFKQQVLMAGAMTPKDNDGKITKTFIDSYGAEAGLTNMTNYTRLTITQQMSVAEYMRKCNAANFAQFDAAFTTIVNSLVGNGNEPGQPTRPTNPSNPGGTTTIIPPTTPPTTPPTEPTYNDIANVTWAHEAIKELSKRSIFEGYDDGSFKPDNSILREEFIKISVVGMFGKAAIAMDAKPSYTDAQDGWFAPYVAAAEDKKMTAGIGGGLFGTGNEITRQDMALMLYRMLRDAGVNVSTEEYNFVDKDQIADYAKEAVYALKNLGIINGYEDGSFQPVGSTTRAEAAVMLYKTLDKLGKIIR